MKRVSEIAEELDVSKQTIYYWIEKLGQDIERHIYKDKNAKVIADKGLDMIREKVKGKTQIERPYKSKNNYPIERPADKEKEALKERVKDLKQQNKLLEKQLEQKDKQISRLHDSLDKSQDKIEALAGQVQESNRSFIEKLKGLFK